MGGEPGEVAAVSSVDRSSAPPVRPDDRRPGDLRSDDLGPTGLATAELGDLHEFDDLDDFGDLDELYALDEVERRYGIDARDDFDPAPPRLGRTRRFLALALLPVALGWQLAQPIAGRMVPTARGLVSGLRALFRAAVWPLRAARGDVVAAFATLRSAGRVTTSFLVVGFGIAAGAVRTAVRTITSAVAAGAQALGPSARVAWASGVWLGEAGRGFSWALTARLRSASARLRAAAGRAPLPARVAGRGLVVVVRGGGRAGAALWPGVEAGLRVAGAVVLAFLGRALVPARIGNRFGAAGWGAVDRTGAAARARTVAGLRASSRIAQAGFRVALRGCDPLARLVWLLVATAGQLVAVVGRGASAAARLTFAALRQLGLTVAAGLRAAVRVGVANARPVLRAVGAAGRLAMLALRAGLALASRVLAVAGQGLRVGAAAGRRVFGMALAAVRRAFVALTGGLRIVARTAGAGPRAAAAGGRPILAWTRGASRTARYGTAAITRPVRGFARGSGRYAGLGARSGQARGRVLVVRSAGAGGIVGRSAYDAVAHARLSASGRVDRRPVRSTPWANRRPALAPSRVPAPRPALASRVEPLAAPVDQLTGQVAQEQQEPPVTGE